MHGIDLAERTHHRTAPQLPAHAVARENQLARIEQLPGEEAGKIGRQTVKPLHGGKCRRGFAGQFFCREKLGRSGCSAGRFLRHGRFWPEVYRKPNGQ